MVEQLNLDFGFLGESRDCFRNPLRVNVLEEAEKNMSTFDCDKS